MEQDIGNIRVEGTIEGIFLGIALGQIRDSYDILQQRLSIANDSQHDWLRVLQINT